MTVRVTDEAAAVALAAMTALVNVGGRGKLRLYSGVRPSISLPIDSQVLLVEFQFAATAFQTPAVLPTAGATAVANPMTPAEAIASGNASFYRVYSGEDEVLWDGSITTNGGGGDLIVTSIAVTQGTDIVVTSFSITLPS